jgi:hypothetical protein
MSDTTDVKPDPLLWDYPETQRQLGKVSRKTVQRLGDRGEIDIMNIGPRRFHIVPSVRAYVARRTRKPKP